MTSMMKMMMKLKLNALKIENNILKDKIKASKRPIKVLEQQHDRFTWKKT